GPDATTRALLIVTFDAVTSTVPWMDRSDKTAPLPVTSTSPSEVLDQPGPFETWPGTDRSATPAWTPLVVVSGKPHRCEMVFAMVWSAAGAHPVIWVPP